MLGIGHIIIIGKTANFTHVQKTVIDTLHNEGKLQKVFAKEVFFFQKMLYPSVLTQNWTEGKVW